MKKKKHIFIFIGKCDTNKDFDRKYNEHYSLNNIEHTEKFAFKNEPQNII